MATTPPLDRGQLQRQRPGEPEPVRDPRQQRGPRVRYQARSVRRDFYRYRTSITHHPQGEPPSSGSRTFSKPKDPCSTGRFRAPARRGARPSRDRYRTLGASGGAVATTMRCARSIRVSNSMASGARRVVCTACGNTSAQARRSSQPSASAGLSATSISSSFPRLPRSGRTATQTRTSVCKLDGAWRSSTKPFASPARRFVT
jgi:hypothetical protein